MADPLAPFINQLLTVAVPALILAGIVGLVLGSLRVAGERWLEGFFRRLVHGKSPDQVAKVPGPPVRSTAVPDAPNCPTCTEVMVSRVARRGSMAGQSFWGCPGYPKCRGTRAAV